MTWRCSTRRQWPVSLLTTPAQLTCSQALAPRKEESFLLDQRPKPWKNTTETLLLLESSTLPPPWQMHYYSCCIDYQGLNMVTSKNLCLLPFMSSVFELLHGAFVYTILDIRNAYHWVHIKDKDEWKTAFNTTTGVPSNCNRCTTNKYLIMLLRMMSAPAVFQAFINDMLNHLAYLDNILIFSISLHEYIWQVLQWILRKNLKPDALSRLFQPPELSQNFDPQFHNYSPSSLVNWDGCPMDTMVWARRSSQLTFCPF